MAYNILNPVLFKQIGTICIIKKNSDYRPIYGLDENDVAFGADLKIGSANNYSQPQFITDKDGNCMHNPLFHSFLCKKVGKCTLILLNENNEWDNENKMYFYDLSYSN